MQTPENQWSSLKGVWGKWCVVFVFGSIGFLFGRLSLGWLDWRHTFYNPGLMIIAYVFTSAILFLPISMLGGLIIYLVAYCSPELLRRPLASIQTSKASMVAILVAAVIGLMWTLIAGKPMIPEMP